ncbi:RNA-binding domain-containing protein [Paenibacillus illinoisensis]|uniref:RNA-binding domain-containing protein n=1 Tax=Paenibacillus illinoisensis TaxID=59845 RepID=A0ABW8HRM7_9BACL
MKVRKVISNMNAWNLLNNKYKQEVENIISVVENTSYFSDQPLSETNTEFENKLLELGWEDKIILKKGVWLFDKMKNHVAIELCLGKQASLESKIFLKAQLSYKYKLFEVAIFVVPTNTKQIRMKGVNTFENIRNSFIDLSPYKLNYPFIVLGIDETKVDEKDDIELMELTTDLDEYLMKHTENSLDTLIAMGEKTNYDFKEELPENKKIAQEISAFANMDGGFLILGVTDSGQISGVNNELVDDIQQKIVNVIRDSCNPSPDIELHTFKHNLLQGKSIIVVEVKAMAHKPCMTQEKIYIRVGSTVRTAKPDEIRRLILL